MSRYALLLHALPDGTSHYDLLLEHGDALAAWRLPAPPAQLPPEGAEASALQAHRPLYLDYEGEVSGGRGTVRRVDAGTYEAMTWDDSRVVVRVEGASAHGVLEVEAHPGGTWRVRFTA